MPITLSIIVVTLNEAAHVIRLKQALDRLQLPGSIRIESILVDGGSSDGTAVRAQECGFSKVLTLPGASIPVCRNRGLNEASGGWVAFVDGDCAPAPDWVMEAAPYLDPAKPVIVGWPVHPPAGDTTWVQRAWHAHWMHKNRAKMATSPITHEAFRLITTRNMLLTRKTLSFIAGFDEALETGEDTDFVFRAAHGGATAIAVPSLHVAHFGEPATLGAFFRQQLWHANRLSYARIAQTTGGKAGGNAPRFTILFLLGLILVAGGILLSLACQTPAFLLLALPWFALVAGPAVMIASRARAPSLFPPLCALYLAYGTARSLDLLGLNPRKSSWKKRH